MGWYAVEARKCTCCKDVPVRYLVYNAPRVEGIDGKGLLAMSFDWDRLCHVGGWYPLDGLDVGDRVPREPAPTPNPVRPKATKGSAAPKPPESAPEPKPDPAKKGQLQMF